MSSAYTDPRPLSSRLPAERELLAQFQSTEHGADHTFSELPTGAKRVAYELMSLAKNKQELTQLLDTSEDFRHEIGCEDMNVLPKETDVVLRYYDWKAKNGLE